MGYALYSRDGFVDLLGSATRWGNLIDEVEKHRTSGPLFAFVETGETENPKGVVRDIDKIIPKVRNHRVRSSLEELRESLKKAKEIAIVADS